ncbi:YbjQ family protein [Nocardia heshunensis]
MSVDDISATTASNADTMLVSTMNDLPGYEVVEVLGDVFGLTVRSRHLGSQIGAGIKSMFGGELKGMTKMLFDSRIEAQQRMIELAREKGADAILAMRFDANDFGDSGQEICAYGTAVRIRRL